MWERGIVIYGIFFLIFSVVTGLLNFIWECFKNPEKEAEENRIRESLQKTGNPVPDGNDYDFENDNCVYQSLLHPITKSDYP